MGDEKAPEQQQGAGGGGLDVRLIGLCVLLWVVAGGILWQNWPDTKRDYYWGNIMQGLEGQPPRVDHESVKVLAAMGDAIIPSCSHELTHHSNPQFKCAVLMVLEQTEGKGARELIERSLFKDQNPNVRVNALLYLSSRAKRHPEEAEAFKKAAEEVAIGKTSPDPEVEVRTTAALMLAELGDTRPEVKSLLVHGLRAAVNPKVRNPGFMRQCAATLARITSGSPAFDVDAKGKDMLDAIIAYETWCVKTGGIALIESPLTIAPVATAAGTGAVTTKSGDGK